MVRTNRTVLSLCVSFVFFFSIWAGCENFRVEELERPERDLTGRLGSSQPTMQFRFGSAVATNGDYIAVGEPGFDIPTPRDEAALQDVGAVQVFRRGEGGSLTFMQTLISPSPAAGDNFGTSVAIAGNLLIVGVPGEDTDVDQAGAAYLFTLDDSGFFVTTEIEVDYGNADLGED